MAGALMPGTLPCASHQLVSFQSAAASDMILLIMQARIEACSHSSVAQWQSIRLLTGGL